MADKSSFTKEDLTLALQLGQRVLETKFGQLKKAVVQNVQEALDPDIRLAGRIRAKYNALREADFTHEEAVKYTSESVNKTIATTLSSLTKTEDQDKEGGN